MPLTYIRDTPEIFWFTLIGRTQHLITLRKDVKTYATGNLHRHLQEEIDKLMDARR